MNIRAVVYLSNHGSRCKKMFWKTSGIRTMQSSPGAQLLPHPWIVRGIWGATWRPRSPSGRLKWQSERLVSAEDSYYFTRAALEAFILSLQMDGYSGKASF